MNIVRYANPLTVRLPLLFPETQEQRTHAYLTECLAAHWLSKAWRSQLLRRSIHVTVTRPSGDPCEMTTKKDRP